jgi:hypothetical protein
MPDIRKQPGRKSLHATQIAIEYSGFYVADTIMAKNRGSTVLHSKIQERRTASE